MEPFSIARLISWLFHPFDEGTVIICIMGKENKTLRRLKKPWVPNIQTQGRTGIWTPFFLYNTQCFPGVQSSASHLLIKLLSPIVSTNWRTVKGTSSNCCVGSAHRSLSLLLPSYVLNKSVQVGFVSVKDSAQEFCCSLAKSIDRGLGRSLIGQSVCWTGLETQLEL